MLRDNCDTVQSALATITSIEELDSFTEAIRNPDLDTMTPTETEWKMIADMKIEFHRRRGRK